MPKIKTFFHKCSPLYRKRRKINATEIFYLADSEKTDLPFYKIYCNFNKIDYVISDYDFKEETKNKLPKTKFILTHGLSLQAFL